MNELENRSIFVKGAKMKLFQCKFETDVLGVYLTPLIGLSRVNGKLSFWIGWLFWLFTVTF